MAPPDDDGIRRIAALLLPKIADFYSGQRGLAGLLGVPSAGEKIIASQQRQNEAYRGGDLQGAFNAGMDNPLTFALGTGNLRGSVTRTAVKRLAAVLSDKSRSGSKYYTLPDGRNMRISDHDLSSDRGTSARHIDLIVDPEGSVTIKHDVLDPGANWFREKSTTLELDTSPDELLHSNGEPWEGYRGFSGNRKEFFKALNDAIGLADSETKR